MKRITGIFFMAIAMTIAVVSAIPAAGGDHYWPQWRGPLASGVAPVGDPPIEWAPDRNIKWKVEIPGKGSATPIVWGDNIFVLTAAPTDKRAPGTEKATAEAAPPQGAQAGKRPNLQPEFIQQFIVIAINRNDGRTLWQKIVREELPHEGWNPNATITWASSSPVTDGQMVYAYFGSRGLYALDMKGNVRWERDFGDMDTGGFGEGSSPALDGDRLVVNWDHEGESFIVALDKNTGKELWRTPRDEKTTYSTPLIVEHGGRKQVITPGTRKVRSYDLADGKLLWEAPGLTRSCVPTPVHADGVVYVMCGYGGSALYAIRLAQASGDITGTQQAVAWKYDRDTPWVPSPLLYGDELYFLKSNSAILSVFNARTGEKHYGEQRLEGLGNVYASPVGAAGRVYIAGREGAVAVIERGPRFKLLALNQLDDGFDASPVVVGNEIYLRGRKHLYRISKEIAQSAGSSAEQQIYDRYRNWMSGVPVDQRGPGLLTLYRQHLQKEGVPPAEIDRQIGIIEREGRRLEAERWNTFFTADRPRFNVMPNAFLVQMAERRQPGTALDVGMGQGRNSLWLARQGWQVTGFDPAAQALAMAQQNAASLGLSLKTVEARDDTFDWGDSRWDLILLSYAGCSAENVPRIERALKPGGLLVVEAFHTDVLREFKIGGSLCGTGQLPQMFQGLRSVHYEEPIALPDFGQARMRIVRFAAEKPR